MAQNKEKIFLDAYEKHADDIYRHCYFRVYNKELAEDITQETFIKTWKYILAGQEIKNIKAFLYRVAVNLIIDDSRKKKEIYLDDFSKKESKEAIRLYNMEDGMFKKFEFGQIIKLLDELPEHHKQVIVMRFVDDLLPNEIADILEETPNAVSVRISQGIKKLKEINEQRYRQNFGESQAG